MDADDWASDGDLRFSHRDDAIVRRGRDDADDDARAMVSDGTGGDVVRRGVVG